MPASDIGLGPGANGGIAAPSLTSAAYSGTQLSLRLAPSTAPLTLEIYLFGANDRVFQASANLAANQSLVTVTVPGLTNGDQIIATATDSAGDTSPFSNAVTIASPLVVTNTFDSGSGSLRAAIINADATSGATISFDIPGGGPFVISLLSPLPAITATTAIDATTQPGFTNKPLVEVFGGNLGGMADGLLLAPGADSSTIKGLDLAAFGGAGIHVQSNGDIIVGNFLGTDLTGKAAGPGNTQGILIDTGTGTTIGGAAAGSANIIGFNAAGVVLQSAGNLVIGNFIGTDAAGDKLGNTTGVSISGSNNTVGGTTAGSPNVIGASTTNVLIQAAGTNNIVLGDFIGTDAAGDNLGVSGSYGVRVLGTGNTIGGTAAGSADTIGFNSTGVSLEGQNNAVLGSFIGTTAAGANRGNAVGIAVSAAGNTIGGVATGAADVIGDNTTAGVSLSGSNNLVQGDFIGTDAAAANLNNVIGVLVTGSANTIGGTSAAAADTIAFNATAGIQINGAGATTNVVQGDFIGTNAGSATLGNGIGVQIVGGSNNLIGGTTAGSPNTIGSNLQNGVSVLSGSGNAIHQNLYTGTNGTTAYVPASDIALAPGANSGIAAPVLSSASYDGTTLSIRLAASTQALTLEVYVLSTGPDQRHLQDHGAGPGQRHDREHPGGGIPDHRADPRDGDQLVERHLGVLERGDDRQPVRRDNDRGQRDGFTPRRHPQRRRRLRSDDQF